MPLQPSTAQTRSANFRAAASISAYPALSVPYLPAASTAACSSMTSIVAERLCGSIPMITPTDSSSASPVISGEEGTATSSWANPFRASPRTVPGEMQAMSEPRQ